MVEKVKKIIATIYKSITSPAYYLDVINSKLSTSYKYFFSLALISTIIVTVVSSIPLIPKIRSAVDYIYSTSGTLYPNDLVITLNNGDLEINQEEPYFIAFPKGNNLGIQDVPENLIVFDSNGTIEDFTKYNTIMLVNNKNLLVTNSTGTGNTTSSRVDVYPLEEMPNGTFSRADYDAIRNQAAVYVNSAPAILSALVVLFIFAATIMYFFVFRSIYLFLMASVLYAIGMIKGIKLNFAQYYQVALHAMTFPLLLELVSFLAKVTIPLPMWFFVLNFVVGLIAIFKIAEDPKSKVEKKPDVA